MTDHGIKVIADHYGKKHQTIKTMEELAELIQALAREDVENIKNTVSLLKQFALIQLVLLVGNSI